MSYRDDAIVKALRASAGLGGGAQDIPVTGAADPNRPTPSLALVELPPECARSWRVTLGAPAPRNGLPPFVYGVNTPPGFPPSVPNINFSRDSIVCKLQWGTGGSILEAFLDWRSGCSFVVHGSVVRVQALVPANAVLPGAPAGITSQVNFPASISPADSGASTIPPTFTFDSKAVAAAGNVVGPVPPFARGYRPTRYSGTVTERFTVTFAADAAIGTPLAVYDYNNVSTNNHADVRVPMLVPANARFFQIINFGAGAGGWMNVFDLDLG